MTIILKLLVYGATAVVGFIFLITLVGGIFQVIASGISEPALLDHATAQRIIREYGAATLKQVGRGAAISDARRLPFPKARIKQALLFAAAMTSDDQAREQLKCAYMTLADWQDGLGDDIPADLGISTAPKNDLRKSALHIASVCRRFQEWSPRMLEECIALGAEFDAVLANIESVLSGNLSPS